MSLIRSARRAFVLTTLLVIPTILFGVMDWVHFYKSAPLPAIRMKVALAAILVVVAAAGMALRRPDRSNRIVMLIVCGLAFPAVVGLGCAGANLVHGEPVAESAPASSGCHPRGGNVVEPTIPLKTSAALASCGELYLSLVDTIDRGIWRQGAAATWAAC